MKDKPPSMPTLVIGVDPSLTKTGLAFHSTVLETLESTSSKPFATGLIRTIDEPGEKPGLVERVLRLQDRFVADVGDAIEQWRSDLPEGLQADSASCVPILFVIEVPSGHVHRSCSSAQMGSLSLYGASVGAVACAMSRLVNEETIPADFRYMEYFENEWTIGKKKKLDRQIAVRDQGIRPGPREHRIETKKFGMLPIDDIADAILLAQHHLQQLFLARGGYR